MLPEHVELVMMEVAVGVGVEVHSALVDRLEIAAVLENLFPMTPPGAMTVLCLHAVDGGSSSVLWGRTRLPLTHRAAGRGC